MSRPTVLITGAAKRIGKATAVAFAERGCNVAVHYNRSFDDAKQLQNALQQYSVDCLLISADLADENSLSEMISACTNHFGRLDHLVNNASIFYPTPQSQMSWEQLHAMLQINYFAPRKLIKLAAPFLSANQGSVTNLIDIYADAGLAEHAFYVSAKAALKALTREMAIKLAPAIRVNGVSPGAILWPELAGLQKNLNESKESHPESQTSIQSQQRIIQHSALKRLGSPQAIAATLIYLSLDACYTTGSVIRVDGGRRDYI